MLPGRGGRFDFLWNGRAFHSEIAEALDSGIPVQELTYIPGTVFKTRDISGVYDAVVLPSFEESASDKQAYAKSFALQYENTDPFTARPLVESYGAKGYVVQNPPARPLTQTEMDDVYGLPYAGPGIPCTMQREGFRLFQR